MSSTIERCEVPYALVSHPFFDCRFNPRSGWIKPGRPFAFAAQLL
jgi:hypothetical protein